MQEFIADRHYQIDMMGSSIYTSSAEWLKAILIASSLYYPVTESYTCNSYGKTYYVAGGGGLT